jgi:hypothetical protein
MHMLDLQSLDCNQTSAHPDGLSWRGWPLVVGACAMAFGLASPVRAQAQAAPPVTAEIAASGASATPAAPPSESALRTAASRYQGRFSSSCDSIADGLYARDIIDLQPSGTRVEAQYHKAFFTDKACGVFGHLVTMHLPPVVWQVDGSAAIGSVTAEKVTITLTAGLITATVVNKAKVQQTPEQWILIVGDDSLPISKQAEGSVDKEVRAIVNDQLLLGDPETLGPDGYPTVLMSNPLIRQSSSSKP